MAEVMSLSYGTPSTSPSAAPTPWLSPSSSARSSLSNSGSGWHTWSGEGGRRSRRTSADGGELLHPHSSHVSDSSSRPRSGRSTPGDFDPATDSHRQPSTMSSRTHRSTHGRASASMSAAGKADQWWESVLPPGQLAERLRRAQALGPHDTEPVQSRTANMSERSIWSGLAELTSALGSVAKGSGSNSSSGASTPPAGVRRRATSSIPTYRSGGWSASEARMSLGGRSSGSNTSGTRSSDTSGDEHHGPSRGHSRRSSFVTLSDLREREAESTVGKTWPETDRLAPPSRITTKAPGGDRRRSRVLSEDGVGLGIADTWGYQPHPHGLSRGSGRASPLYHSSTPEHGMSSEEGESDLNGPDSAAGSSTTVRRTRVSHAYSSTMIQSALLEESFDSAASSSTDKTSKRRSLPPAAPSHESARALERDHHLWNSKPRTRRVSFEKGVKPADLSQPIIEGKALQMPFPSVRVTSSSSHQQSTATPFDSLPPSASGRHGLHGARRSRTVSSDGYVRGGPSFSAPTSPRASIHLQDHERPRFEPYGPHFVRPTDGASRRKDSFQEEQGMPSNAAASTVELDEMAILRSLGAAQHQLSNAGNLALTLTRQLSAPLRPVLQLWLFLSISSVTLITLFGFLMASYVLTVFDDLANRGKTVGTAASKARRNVEAGLQSCRRILDGSAFGIYSTSPGAASSSSSSSPSGSKSQAPTGQRRRAASVLFPLQYMSASISGRFAAAEPKPSPAGSTSTTDKKEQRKAASDDGNDSSTSSRAKESRPASTSSAFPPRPPLSYLLPSLFFTLLLALFAGLASFFANRRASAPGASAAGSGPSHGAHRSTTPRSPMSSTHASMGGHHGFAHTYGSHSGASSPSMSRRSSLRASSSKYAHVVYPDMNSSGGGRPGSSLGGYDLREL